MSYNCSMCGKDAGTLPFTTQIGDSPYCAVCEECWHKKMFRNMVIDK